jgi:hypothetical protein
VAEIQSQDRRLAGAAQQRILGEKEVDMWRAAVGDPYPMEKNPDEIPMFTRFAERSLSLPASDFFKGLLGYYSIEYLNLNPQWYLSRLSLRTFL